MKQNFYALLAAALLASSLLQGQDTTYAGEKRKDPLKTAFAEGLTVSAADTSYEINFGFRFQNLFVAEALDNNFEKIDAQMMVRRCRLKADGFVFSPDIVYK